MDTKTKCPGAWSTFAVPKMDVAHANVRAVPCITSIIAPPPEKAINTKVSMAPAFVAMQPIAAYTSIPQGGKGVLLVPSC